jgi:hypothetical protein
MVHYDPLGNNTGRPNLERNETIGGHLWQFVATYPDKDGYCHLVALPGPGVAVGRGHDIPYLTRPLDPADDKAYPFLKETPHGHGGLSHYWELFQSYRVFEAKAGGKLLTLDIELDPGCQVEGMLVGPDAKPVVGAVAVGLAHSPQNTKNVVYRENPAHRARVESRTLEADRFVAAGLIPGGARTVTFLHAGRKLIANVTIRANQEGPLPVRMEPWGAVTGRVVDAAGKPVPGLTVELLYGGVAPGLLAPGQPFRTDGEGRYRVEGLIPGHKHRLTFAGQAGMAVTPLALEGVKDLSTKAGEVRDLKDIRVKVTPAAKPERGAADE